MFYIAQSSHYFAAGILAAAALATAAPDVNPLSTPSSPSQVAMPQLLKMSKFFEEELQNFSYNVLSGYDVVQPDGQKIEFMEKRQITVGRPSHLRVDFEQSDGELGRVFYDGARLTVHHSSENTYATTETAGSIDNVLDFANAKLGIRMPLAMLLRSDLSKVLQAKVQSADVVGTCTVGGASCTQIAMRGADVDIQVYLENGKQPYPRRIVLTYKKEQGSPQYWANLNDWKSLPAREDGLFVFSDSENAEKIEFRQVKQKEQQHELH
jgi:hypothetical protein